MNKFTKGAIATAAGIVLLLGGAGTFALWNDSADIAGGDITSGTLSLVEGDAGEWTNGATVIDDIEDFLIVPGDVVEYSQTFEIDATGDNLKALLGVYSDDFIDAAETAGFDPGDLTVDVVVTGAASGTAEITDADHGNDVEVVVTVTFDEFADNDSQGLTVNLTSLDITLSQHL